MSLPVIKEKASPRRRNPIFQFSFFGKPSPQRIKEHFENLEQQSELLKGKFTYKYIFLLRARIWFSIDCEIMSHMHNIFVFISIDYVTFI